MGYYVVHKFNVSVCKRLGKAYMDEHDIFCTHITEHSANKTMEKLESLGHEDFKIKRGCCMKHFDYNERIKIEFDEEGHVNE